MAICNLNVEQIKKLTNKQIGGKQAHSELLQ